MDSFAGCLRGISLCVCDTGGEGGEKEFPHFYVHHAMYVVHYSILFRVGFFFGHVFFMKIILCMCFS